MKKVLTITIFVLIQTKLYAIDNFFGKKIGIENGLSQESVTCITYNNNGTLWIGTRFGLNEYSNGKIHSYLDNTTGFSGCHINSLYCDKDNALWISCAKGLYRFDNNSSNFSCIINESTNCVLEHNDSLYIGGHKGLLRYNKVSDSLEGTESQVWTDILNIYEYKDSLLCIDRRNGITLYYNGKHNSLPIPDIEEQTLMASYLDNNLLYLSILGKGILIYDIENKTTIHCIYNKELAIVLALSKIKEKIWIGTDGNGVQILDTKDYSIKNFHKYYSTNPGTEIPQAVTCIFQDPLDNIWLGGVQFGLTGLKQSSMRSFLTDNAINFIYISEQKNRVFVGTNGQGLYSYSLDYTESSIIKGTENMKITSVSDFDDTSLLLCAYNEGFFIYDYLTNNLKPFTIIDKHTNELECFYGNSPEIYKLKDGRILIFAAHNYIFDKTNKSFNLFSDNIDGGTTDLQSVYSDNTERIFSFSKEGIFKISVQECRIERVLSPTVDLGAINCISYTDSCFVFGTDYGLFKLNTKDFSYNKIPCPLFNRVTELRYAKNGALWIGADNTLFKYENDTFELMGEKKGVASNEISNSAITKDGVVFLAGSKGFLSIDDNEINTIVDTCEKRIVLHDIILDGKQRQLQKESLIVPHKNENLQISISLSNSDPLDKTVYRYTLNTNPAYSIETFDEITKLPIVKPGKYSLSVSYLKSKGEWSKPQTIINIVKKAPWYKSTTMYLVYLFTLVALVSCIIFYLRKRIEEELEAEQRNRDKSFIEKFELYIDSHLGENELNVDQIASDLALSRATLYTKVKRSFKLGIGEYIELKRIAKAKELLRGTKLSVTEISEKVGYSTTRYFSARFKKATGESPLTYRKNTNI